MALGSGSMGATASVNFDRSQLIVSSSLSFTVFVFNSVKQIITSALRVLFAFMCLGGRESMMDFL